MISVAIISDDFTGALDTGVQFAQYGLTVKIAKLQEVLEKGYGGSAVDVSVVNAELRHLSSQEAYDVTYRLVEKAKDSSVSHIYIKTDSGLRGNIGSELQAALEASGQNFLPFLPAFPKMNRITKNGVHYIEGVPIHQSVFGKDPFEPVLSPYLRNIFAGLPVHTELIPVTESFDTDYEKPVIGIFDSETNDDFHRIAAHLSRKDQLKVVAGCAGFAAILPEYIGFQKKEVTIPCVNKPLVTVCGSLNPITRKQIEYAEKKGSIRIAMQPHQILTPQYFSSEEGKAWVDSLENVFTGDVPVMIDTGISQRIQMETYLNTHNVEIESVWAKVSFALGEFMEQIFSHGYIQNRTLMIIGGDTLLGFIRQMDLKEISPVCELNPGTVLSVIQIEGQKLWLISKSGGFGDENLLEEISHRLAENRL